MDPFRYGTSRIAWAPSDGGSPAGSGTPSGGAAAGGEPNSGAAASGAGGGGSPAAAGFLEQVPADIRGEAYFRDIRDVPSLATKAFHQAKLIGVPPDQLIRVAGPEDTAAWEGIWTKLGRPESPDKYSFTDPAELPAGFTIDPEQTKAFAAEMHKLGLTQKQAAAVRDHILTTRTGAFKHAVQSEADGLKAAEGALRQDWGQAFEERAEASNVAIDHFERVLGLNGQLEAAIKEMPAAARVPLAKLLAHLGGQIRPQEGLPGRGGGGNGGPSTPVEARQQINALQQDPTFVQAWRDRRHPGHQDAVNRMLALHEMLAPSA
jgi:hypothetical protein